LAALKNPARPEPHRFLSVALLKVGREQLALHETGIYYQLLGEQFLAGGDYQHAAECFANAVKCDSSNTAARNALEQLRGVAPAVGGQ